VDLVDPVDSNLDNSPTVAQGLQPGGMSPPRYKRSATAGIDLFL